LIPLHPGHDLEAHLDAMWRLTAEGLITDFKIVHETRPTILVVATGAAGGAPQAGGRLNLG